MEKRFSPWLERGVNIIAFLMIVGALHVARDVLVPITLAVILSFLMMPIVNRLRVIGFGQTLSIAVTVTLVVVLLGIGTLAIGTRLLHVAESLPDYADTIHDKISTLNKLTLNGVSGIKAQLDTVIADQPEISTVRSGRSRNAAPPGPMTVRIQKPETDPIELLRHIIGSLWPPIASTGVVLAVLVFVLFEHEALRDRFIRITGSRDLRGTTIAVNEAGQRLSRFFLSQLIVNTAVGVLLAVALWAVGLPEALLFGMLAFLLRFVPYVGIWIAAILAIFMGVAVVPGWTVALLTLSLFVIIEVTVAQFVEPLLYGHSTGLSPLSVVVAAIAWSWLWGPIGLVLSTPLTLCLVVFGRYFRALNIFEILLADMPALTLPQRFYQRALSGDVREILADAKTYIKKKSLPAYCDAVMLPALLLARADLDVGTITQTEQLAVANSIASVVDSLSAESLTLRRTPKIAALDANLGQILRRRRESAMGKPHQSLDAPKGGIVIAIPGVEMGDALIAEMLVRILRKQGIDARHLTQLELSMLPAGTRSEEVRVCFLVSVAARTLQRSTLDEMLDQVETHLPQARAGLLSFRSPFDESEEIHADAHHHFDIVRSFEEALLLCKEAV